MAPHERAGVVEVSADPLALLDGVLLGGELRGLFVGQDPEAVLVRVLRRIAEGLLEVRLRGAVLLRELAGDVGGGLLAGETGEAGVAGEVLHLAERFPPVAVGTNTRRGEKNE